MFDIGGWVKVTRNDYLDWVGYIQEKHPILNQYRVYMTLDGDGKQVFHKQQMILGVFNFEMEEAELATGFDTSFLIDIALDTKDEEWFLSLWKENIEKGENENVER
jgi:hypothetical protein